MQVNNSKPEHANVSSDATGIDFTSFLQKLMIEGRFDADERKINSECFLRFKHLALLATAEKLYKMSKTRRSNAKHEDSNNLKWLKSNADSLSSSIELKITSVLQLFNK